MPVKPDPQPSDPWRLFQRLNRILTANTSPDGLIDDFLALLHSIPEIESSWFGQADEAGNIHCTVSRGAFLRPYNENDKINTIVNGAHNTGPAGRAWQTGEPHYCEDWQTDPAVAPYRESNAGLNWQSSAAIPLRGQSGPHSIIAIYSNKPGFFPHIWSQDVLVQIAAVLGNALESRLKHTALTRTRQLYETMFTSANELSTSRSEMQILRIICKRLIDSGLFLSASIGVVDKDNVHAHLVSLAQHNARVLRAAKFRRAKGESAAPLSVLAWDAGTTMVANHYRTDARFKPVMHVAEKVGFKSVAAFIIRRAAKRWAVMSVTSSAPDFFGNELVRMLEQMVGMVGHRLDELDLKAALRAEREAQSRIAREDQLTGLPNQLAFEEQLASSMARALRHKKVTGVGLIDIDRFKQFNESWGTAAGDIILKEVADRLRRLLRGVDFVARTGGDEFALIMEDWSWTHDIEGLCGRLQVILNAPIAVTKSLTVQITVSAGFTLFPLDDASPAELLRHAGVALYAARASRDRFEKFWRVYIDVAGGTKDQFAGRSLLNQGALEVYYQPVMNLHTGHIVSVEALARLNDGSRLIMPGKFLRDLLLDDRMMLFRQMIETAMAQLREWDCRGIAINVSVNVDAEILLLDRTLPYLVALLEDSGIEPRRVVLELLETHDFFDVERARTQLDAIRALGIRIALDDLGAGYSSILKIRDLPIDVVKLDRKFVASLAEQPDDLVFISTFQTLARSLDMDLIVEGVESADVLDALRMLGAHQAQGYFIAKPMPASQFASWLPTFKPTALPAEPNGLLGAYAVHLTWLRAFHFARTQDALLAHLRSHDPFPLKRFLTQSGYLEQPLGLAYLGLQAVMHDERADRDAILRASDKFRAALIAALKTTG